MRFLLLDDNRDDRHLALRLLQQEYPQAVADEVFDRNGFDRALAVGGYHAVISDYQMNWTDGIQLVRLVKSHWPDCPFVLFTDSGDEEIAVEAMKSGADDYVLKRTRSRVRLPHAVRRATEHIEAKRRLAEVETHLQELTNALDVGVFQASSEGHLLSCNAAFLRIVGRKSVEEVHAARLDELLLMPPKAGLGRDAKGEAIATRETEVRRPDGSRVWVRLSMRVNNLGSHMVVDGLVADMTERKALEENLKTQTEHLREMDRRKDELLAMLAHELRNPLAPIRNASIIVQRRTTDQADPKVQNACMVIDRQVQILSRLVDDLVDVARVSQGKITLHLALVDVGEAVSRAVEMVRPLMETRRHELTVHLPSEPVRIHADLDRLAQVFENLLNNAAKFTPDGGHLWVSAAADQAEAVVRITDSGIGIAPTLLPHVFDLFTQGDVAIDRSEGGLGVGLTLVKRLVEMHGGMVVAESAGIGKGSTFTVRLPTADRPPVKVESATDRSAMCSCDGKQISKRAS